jgi:hypothetical protein
MPGSKGIDDSIGRDAPRTEFRRILNGTHLRPFELIEGAPCGGKPAIGQRWCPVHGGYVGISVAFGRFE